MPVSRELIADARGRIVNSDPQAQLTPEIVWRIESVVKQWTRDSASTLTSATLFLSHCESLQREAHLQVNCIIPY
jgi:hypothetical protein